MVYRPPLPAAAIPSPLTVWILEPLIHLIQALPLLKEASALLLQQIQKKVTETVKKFIEAYNAMIDEVRTQATTKPDSNYKPLTDDQKNEMNETSIKKLGG